MILSVRSATAATSDVTVMSKIIKTYQKVLFHDRIPLKTSCTGNYRLDKQILGLLGLLKTNY